MQNVRSGHLLQTNVLWSGTLHPPGYLARIQIFPCPRNNATPILGPFFCHQWFSLFGRSPTHSKKCPSVSCFVMRILSSVWPKVFRPVWWLLLPIPVPECFVSEQISHGPCRKMSLPPILLNSSHVEIGGSWCLQQPGFQV